METRAVEIGMRVIFFLHDGFYRFLVYHLLSTVETVRLHTVSQLSALHPEEHLVIGVYDFGHCQERVR